MKMIVSLIVHLSSVGIEATHLQLSTLCMGELSRYIEPNSAVALLSEMSSTSGSMYTNSNNHNYNNYNTATTATAATIGKNKKKTKNKNGKNVHPLVQSRARLLERLATYTLQSNNTNVVKCSMATLKYLMYTSLAKKAAEHCQPLLLRDMVESYICSTAIEMGTYTKIEIMKF